MNNVSGLVRLSIMMFLQFFIWGSWYVTTGNFMGSHGMKDQIAWAYSLVPIAALISPFFLGLIADRFFPSQIVLGTLHLLGGAIMCVVPSMVSEQATEAQMYGYLTLLFLHAICYTPTLSLTNTVGFSNMTNPEKEFPIIRVFGTIGWIAAGLVVGAALKADKSATQYYVAGGAAIALGLYSLTLPNTPPPARGKAIGLGEIVGLDAWKLLGRPAFAVFMICSMLICIPLAAYYAYAQVYVGHVLDANDFPTLQSLYASLFGGDLDSDAVKAAVRSPAAWMTIGQMSEILFMLMIPFVFTRLGVKVMLLVGMLAWVARYALFSFGAEDSVFWMTMLGVALHGICYDFFFVTGFIYTEKSAKPEIRGQAQGLLVMMTQGVGLLIGAQISGLISKRLTTGEGDAAVTDWYTFWMINAGMALAVSIVFALAFWDRVRPTETEAVTDAGAAPIDPGTTHDPAMARKTTSVK